VYRGIIAELANDLLELINRYCDPSAGPLHELGYSMKAEIIEKMQHILLSPPKDRMQEGEGLSPSDNAFKVAVRATQHGLDEQVRMGDKGFAWWAKLHFQIGFLEYMVGHLRYRKTGDLVEKGWGVVESAYDVYPEFFDVGRKPHYQLATFVLRAWRTREEVLRGRLGANPEPPGYILRLQSLMPQDEPKSDPPTGPAIEEEDAPLIKGEMADLPAIDPVLGSYLETGTFDWDVWGNMVPAGSAMAAFGGFGMGPATEW